MTPWTPPGKDPAEHQTFMDGFPEYLYGPVRSWFIGQFSTSGGTFYNIPRMERFDLDARGRFSMAWTLRDAGPEVLFDAIDDEARLVLLDWTVYDCASANWNSPQSNLDLERILSAGYSAWKVGTREGLAGLEQRAPLGVQEAADTAMAAPGDAGRLLSEAWHAAFSLSPQPDLAYRKSIEAVEAAALPKVVPNDTTAHLGKAISQMRTDSNWKLPLLREHPQNPTAGVVIDMMQALWSGHSDRHPGTSTYTPTTQEAAEAAVLLAVPLVQWFSSGAVARR